MSEQLLLAIETSSPRGSVALGRGGRVLAWRTLTASRKHTAELLPAIRDLLHEAGCAPREGGTSLWPVDVVCFSRGPGSFTGLRVAATVARMWQSATGSRVVAVPTLEVIARNALAHPERQTRLATIIDARQGKLFGAVFERDGDELRTVVDAALHEADSWLAELEKPCWVLGEGVAQHAQALAAAGLMMLPEDTWLPDARQVLAIGQRLADAGQYCTAAQIVPAYLRPPECEEVYEQRRAEARQRRGE